jgi:hypothetical protein
VGSGRTRREYLGLLGLVSGVALAGCLGDELAPSGTGESYDTPSPTAPSGTGREGVQDAVATVWAIFSDYEGRNVYEGERDIPARLIYSPPLVAASGLRERSDTNVTLSGNTGSTAGAYGEFYLRSGSIVEDYDDEFVLDYWDVDYDRESGRPDGILVDSQRDVAGQFNLLWLPQQLFPNDSWSPWPSPVQGGAPPSRGSYPSRSPNSRSRAGRARTTRSRYTSGRSERRADGENSENR